MHRCLYCSLLILWAAPALYSGDDTAELLRAMQQQLLALNSRLEAQQKTIDAQQKMLTALAGVKQPIGATPANEVLTRIEKAEEQSARALKLAARRPAKESTLSVGAAVDTAFRYFDGDNTDAGSRAAGNDFSVRSAELVFFADVDKYFKSYIVLATHEHGEEAQGHEHEAGLDTGTDDMGLTLEEAAIYTSSLNHVEVKAGRFFVPFGRLSQMHDHELPFVTRPNSLDRYIGGESGADGIQAQARIPIDHFLEITGGAFNKVGHEFPLLNAAPGRRNGAELTYFLKGLTRFHIGDAHTFELGISTLQVPDKLIRRDLTNLEFTYRLRSDDPDQTRLVWGTEIMRNGLRTRYLTNEEEVEELDADPIFARELRTGWGGYSYAEYFFDEHWSMGPRIDVFQNVDPAESSQRTYDITYSLLATYRFSEFSRIRAEFSRREFFNGSSANEFFLQWTVFWGAHSPCGQHGHHDHAHGHAHDHHGHDH